MKTKEQLFNDYFKPESVAQEIKYDIMQVIKYAQNDAILNTELTLLYKYSERIGLDAEARIDEIKQMLADS